MIPRPLFRYRVVPALPAELEPLAPLAYNLHWAWDPEAIDLFRRLDPLLWERSGHNPALMLGTIDQGRLRVLARDDGFRAQMERAQERLRRYLAQPAHWPQDALTPSPLSPVARGLPDGAAPADLPPSHNPSPPGREAGGEGGDGPPLVAYFSMEFGLTECLRIYAGGLGILAGDHLKSASDLALPLVAVGLLYQQGYFQQYLNPDGWQQERFPQNDFHNLPIQPLLGAGGAPLTVSVEFPGRPVLARLWQAQVGRLPLYLLDTNLPENAPADRAIADQLYGGDIEKRMQQELILGVGGLRALDLLGRRPTVCHMNEGHSAFLALERMRQFITERGASFEEARALATAGNVFTTHTPVSAGSDYFPPELVDRYLGHYYGALGLSRDQFLALGRKNPHDHGEYFCTTILALHLAGFRFGVSKLHGGVAHRIWHDNWRDLPEEEVPIGAVTNGVHPATWASMDMASLLERYLGPRWHEAPQDQRVWEGIASIPDEELWRTHERRRERLVAFTRRRIREQRLAAGAPAGDVELAAEVLMPDALTIGFARRFAPYKRATLLLRDPDRLVRILTNPERPVQLIFAGKAHPHETDGKDLIRQIIHFSRRPEVRRHVVFLEDYDMMVARYMVQGVDVWLNNPRRPQEASGTSGMKATLNGALNLSILDGWWAEAYRPEVGWAIGHGEEYDDLGRQDTIESDALLHLLEVEVGPLFYRRGPDRLPREWIARMKAAMRLLCPVFNTHRMVLEYTQQGYLPAASCYGGLAAEEGRQARDVAAWQARVRAEWPRVGIARVSPEGGDLLRVGNRFGVHAWVRLGELRPEDVAVQLYEGALDQADTIVAPQVLPMQWDGTREDGHYRFSGVIDCQSSGQQGYTVRVVPHHADCADRVLDGLVRWAEAPAAGVY